MIAAVVVVNKIVKDVENLSLFIANDAATDMR